MEPTSKLAPASTHRCCSARLQSDDITHEAAWRLLAQVCQTPFYQRLRVQLQLGYAVFSALRQIHGQTGLLFGVQSPGVLPLDLLQHIQQFLNELPGLIRDIDDANFMVVRRALADQFDKAALPTAQAAELLWQGKLAGRSSDYLSAVARRQFSRSTARHCWRQPTSESGRRRLALPGQQPCTRPALASGKMIITGAARSFLEDSRAITREILSNIAT